MWWDPSGCCVDNGLWGPRGDEGDQGGGGTLDQSGGGGEGKEGWRGEERTGILDVHCSPPLDCKGSCVPGSVSDTE